MAAGRRRPALTPAPAAPARRHRPLTRPAAAAKPRPRPGTRLRTARPSRDEPAAAMTPEARWGGRGCACAQHPPSIVGPETGLSPLPGRARTPLVGAPWCAMPGCARPPKPHSSVTPRCCAAATLGNGCWRQGLDTGVGEPTGPGNGDDNDVLSGEAAVPDAKNSPPGCLGTAGDRLQRCHRRRAATHVKGRRHPRGGEEGAEEGKGEGREPPVSRGRVGPQTEGLLPLTEEKAGVTLVSFFSTRARW